MKFKKILTIELPEFKLEKTYWDKIDNLTGKRVNLAKNSNLIEKELSDTDCILTGFGIKVDKDVIDRAPQLKYVGVLATGYGGVDVEYAKSKNLTVANIPGYATEAVAEFVFSLILSRIRDLERGKKQAKEGNYSEAGFQPTEIKGKIFGVIGMGRIGTRVAELAKSFGADVRYWSKNRKKETESDGLKFEDIDKLISEADFLSLHLSLNKDTQNFLYAERIAKIKSGAILVNTAPMELVDLNTLEQRLRKGGPDFFPRSL